MAEPRCIPVPRGYSAPFCCLSLAQNLLLLCNFVTFRRKALSWNEKTGNEMRLNA